MSRAVLDRLRMSRAVLTSSLSVGSEQLKPCFLTPVSGCYSNTSIGTNKNFLSQVNGYTVPTMLAKAKTKAWKYSMFVNPKQITTIKDGVLSINGKDAFIKVPDNVIVTPCTEDKSSSAFFIGAKTTHEGPRHVFKLGVIQFKMWWMIPRVGSSASDIPVETQMLMLEAKAERHNEGESVSYIVLLPVLDGDFRSSLQGNSADEIEFCVESGKTDVLILFPWLYF